MTVALGLFVALTGLFVVVFVGRAGIEAFVDGEWFFFFYCLLMACCGLLFLVCGVYGAVGGR